MGDACDAYDDMEASRVSTCSICKQSRQDCPDTYPVATTTVEAIPAPSPKPERQIIHELCLILAAVHEHGSERSAVESLPEWLVYRYRWACVQAGDAGRLDAERGQE